MHALSDTEKLAAAERFKTASRGDDPDAMRDVVAHDAVTWHNFDEVELTWEQSARTSSWLRRTVPDLAWTDVATLATSDGFALRSILTGTAPGGPLRLHSCVLATLNAAGLVTRIDEYLDTAQLAVLRG